MSLVVGPFKKSEYGKKQLIFMKRQYWWNWWGIRAYSARRRGGGLKWVKEWWTRLSPPLYGSYGFILNT